MPATTAQPLGVALSAPVASAASTRSGHLFLSAGSESSHLAQHVAPQSHPPAQQATGPSAERKNNPPENVCLLDPGPVLLCPLERDITAGWSPSQGRALLGLSASCYCCAAVAAHRPRQRPHNRSLPLLQTVHEQRASPRCPCAACFLVCCSRTLRRRAPPHWHFGRQALPTSRPGNLEAALWKWQSAALLSVAASNARPQWTPAAMWSGALGIRCRLHGILTVAVAPTLPPSSLSSFSSFLLPSLAPSQRQR